MRTRGRFLTSSVNAHEASPNEEQFENGSVNGLGLWVRRRRMRRGSRRGKEKLGSLAVLVPRKMERGNYRQKGGQIRSRSNSPWRECQWMEDWLQDDDIQSREAEAEQDGEGFVKPKPSRRKSTGKSNEMRSQCRPRWKIDLPSSVLLAPGSCSPELDPGPRHRALLSVCFSRPTIGVSDPRHRLEKGLSALTPAEMVHEGTTFSHRCLAEYSRIFISHGHRTY